MLTTDLDTLSINTIRTLAMDAVQQANSGHPGTPMAMAPVAYALWQRHLRFDPDDPIWPNRDRFVLSMGHASMLLYSMLHLAGVKAVNPKYETLGQLSVGARRHQDASASSTAGARAIPSTAGRPASRRRPARSARGWRPASAWRSPASGWRRTSTARTSRCSTTTSTRSRGDGCMMEGVSREAASLAGPSASSTTSAGSTTTTTSRSKGTPTLAFSEDVATRFIGYGWNVTRVGDANDLEMLDRAFDDVQEDDAAGPR